MSFEILPSVPKKSRNGRRNRSYSDAHVHFATGRSASPDIVDNMNVTVNNFNENPTSGVIVDNESNITTSATSQAVMKQHSGNRPRSKSESEHFPHHRRTSHKKKYPHHTQQRHHHLNYGRHSPPPVSTSCYGKMWIRPKSVRCGGLEAHHLSTSALGDRRFSSLSYSVGSQSQGHPQSIPPAPTAAIPISSSTIKPKAASMDSRSGLEDDKLMMMYTTTSSPSPPTVFGSGFSLFHHNSPTTPIAFGESGKPILRVKHHYQDDDLFESSFLSSNPTKNNKK